MKALRLLAAALAFLWPLQALAGTGTIIVKDQSGATQTFAVVTNGAGAFIQQSAVCDGAAAAQCAAVKLASTAATAADPALVVAISPNNTVAATQSGTWSLNNISGTVSLPTGAATAAKQPALGTAGSASSDVLSVQGIASMTALKVDGSAVTQPVSAASLPLPSGASTSAKQPALGTAGTASSDVITVQGIASMTALKVDGSGVTQPISGTITANAGTNLNTSLLALESGGNLATLAGAITASVMQANTKQWGGTAVVTGGVNGSPGVGGLAANGAAVAGNPVLGGCRAQNAEISAVTNGQAVDEACDLVGKRIAMPYANKENFLAGAASQTSTTQTTLIAAQGANVKIYVTAVQCGNTGATTSTIALNDGSTWTSINPAGGGTNITFPVPLVVAANTALKFTPGSASSTQFCNAQGYAGS